MKVFELMQELSSLPAGAEVIFSSLMTVEEFIRDGPADEIDGKPHYHVKSWWQRLSLQVTKKQFFCIQIKEGEL